jgi:hypothetical protein
MEYLIGMILAFVVVGSATAIGLDRERAFYPTLLMVIASYLYIIRSHGRFDTSSRNRNRCDGWIFHTCHTWVQEESLASGKCNKSRTAFLILSIIC